MTPTQMTLTLGVAVFLTSLPAPALSCSVVNWRPMTFPEQVVAAEIALHARVVDKVNGSYGHFPSAYRGILQVFCVFKGGPLPANLTVDEMGELTSCHHTRVEIDEDYILLLRHEGDTLVPDEVNYLSVAFPADQDHLDQVGRTCGLANFTAPDSSDPAVRPGCPARGADTGTACLGSAGHIGGSSALSAALSALVLLLKSWMD